MLSSVPLPTDTIESFIDTDNFHVPSKLAVSDCSIRILCGDCSIRVPRSSKRLLYIDTALLNIFSVPSFASMEFMMMVTIAVSTEWKKKIFFLANLISFAKILYHMVVTNLLVKLNDISAPFQYHLIQLFVKHHCYNQFFMEAASIQILWNLGLVCLIVLCNTTCHIMLCEMFCSFYCVISSCVHTHSIQWVITFCKNRRKMYSIPLSLNYRCVSVCISVCLN